MSIHRKKLHLLIGGKKAFKKIFKNIRKAKKSVYINVHVWRDDFIGNKMATMLLRAADRGVQVTIVKDQLGAVAEFGDRNNQSFFNKNIYRKNLKLYLLSIASLYFYSKRFIFRSYPFQKENKLYKRLLEHPNIKLFTDQELNDHSKFYIFDLQKLILGGINIGDEYYKTWHDYMVMLDNPELVQRFIKRLKGLGSNDRCPIDFIVDTQTSSHIREKFLELIRGAREKMSIEMSYFTDYVFADELIRASQRGINVEIIMPLKADVVDNLNKTIINYLFKRTTENLTIYFYPKMIHAKLMFIDDEITFLGSANLTQYTSGRILEANILVNDREAPFTKKLKKQLEEDKRHAFLISREQKIPCSSLRALAESSYIEQDSNYPHKSRLVSVISSLEQGIRRLYFEG